ncbi:MAG: hypothetical protein GXP24_14105 [Planctomycetes bacterium]|nr:hypothetical protein [Planctomycetota bacterium]
MRSLCVTLLILAFTLSCSESPPVQQAAVPQSPPQSPSKDSAVETPAVESQAESQSAKAPLAGERTNRLAVRDQAPNFRLQDQEGQDRTLESLLAEGKVAIVFHRSADW